MKIALFHNYYNFPGGEDCVFESESRCLQDLGHQVCQYTIRNADNLSTPSLLTKIKTARNAIFNQEQYAQIKKFLLLEKPSISHVHNWFPLFSPSIYKAHQDAGVPIVQTLHNYRMSCASGNFQRNNQDCTLCINGDYRHAVYHKCYQGSLLGSIVWRQIVSSRQNQTLFHQGVHAYITPSEVVAKKYLKIGIHPSLLHVIPNGCVDVSTSEKNPSRHLSFIFAGRLVREKGISFLIQAWNQLFKEQIDKTPLLHILGTGPLEKEVHSLAKDNPQIIFHGQISHAQLIDKIKKSTALIFPSLWEEPFGLTIIEAMSCGKAVIASDIGAPQEIIQSGETGFLFPPQNINELIKKIYAFMDSPNLTEKLGEKARQRYLSKYTEKAHALQILSLYDEVIKKQR